MRRRREEEEVEGRMINMVLELGLTPWRRRKRRKRSGQLVRVWVRVVRVVREGPRPRKQTRPWVGVGPGVGVDGRRLSTLVAGAHTGTMPRVRRAGRTRLVLRLVLLLVLLLLVVVVVMRVVRVRSAPQSRSRLKHLHPLHLKQSHDAREKYR